MRNSVTERLGLMSSDHVDYVERLTGMKTDELVEVSQDREAGRNLWSRALTHHHHHPTETEKKTIFQEMQ